MNKTITVFNQIRNVVRFFSERLKLERHIPKEGRPAILSHIDSITPGIFKQREGVETKKSVHEILEPPRSYKTLVVSMNRWARFAAIILFFIMKANRGRAHPVKHTGSTDIPVCLNKNAKNRKTMDCLASWGNGGKGFYYGLKSHLASDLKRRVLAIGFTSGNIHESKVFIKLNKGLYGIFVADAAYVGEKLAREFCEENKRILFAEPRKNMKKIMTWRQNALYSTRMRVEVNFRILKQFHGLITSLPRSVNGYLANCICSLLAYVIA